MKAKDTSNKYIIEKGHEYEDPGFVDQRLQESTFIARVAGGDFQLSVSLGKPGDGSFINLKDLYSRHVTLDPLHILGDENLAKFVPAHEGAHCFQTPLHSDIQLELQIDAEAHEKLYDQIAFHALGNVIEDCAINDGNNWKLPGLAEVTRESYKNQQSGQGLLNAPEVKAWYKAYGEIPKFGQAIFYLLAYWAQYRDENDYKVSFKESAPEKFFKQHQDKDIAFILKKLIPSYKKAVATTLQSGKESKAEALAIGLNRFKIIKDEVYPYIKYLVDKDIKNKTLEKFAKNQQETEAISLPKHIKKELEKLNDELQEKALEKFKETIESSISEYLDKIRSADTTNETDSRKAKIDLANKELEDIVKSLVSTGSEAEQNLDGLLKQLKNIAHQEKSSSKEDQLKESTEKIKKELQTDLEQTIKNSKAQTINIERASKALKDWLKKEFEKLTPEEKEAFRQEAEEAFKKLDDIIALKFRPASKEHQKPLHSELSKKSAEKIRVEKENALNAELSAALQKFREKLLSNYDKLLLMVIADLNKAYISLVDNFPLTENPSWQEGFSSGLRVNVGKAMQTERNPSKYDELFDRRTKATATDYAFVVLNDTSGSMSEPNGDPKIKHVQLASIFLGELLNRLQIACAIYAFDQDQVLLKTFAEQVTDQKVRDSLGSLIANQATTNDGDAINAAYNLIKERTEKHKYILVLTDAASMQSDRLKHVLEQVKTEQLATVIHFGVGGETKDVNGYYQFSYADLPTSGHYEETFFEKFCEVAIELVSNPLKFRS